MTHDKIMSLDTQRATVRGERPIGAILVEEGHIVQGDIERVLDVQRANGVRFGEAAVQLGLVTEEAVRYALARQFDFPHLAPTPAGGATGASHELVAAYAPFHPRSEEIRALRTQLLIRWYDRDAGRTALVVTSPGAGEGRSYIAANLAVAFSQLGARTLLVDADLRKPRQAEIFGLPSGQGLSTLLSGRSDHKGAFPVAGLARLSVLPSGPLPPNPQELLSRASFAALIREMQSLHDVVILDTPPAVAYADAQSITFRTGDALVVARKNHTKVGATSRVIRELAGTGARVVGTVVNDF